MANLYFNGPKAPFKDDPSLENIVWRRVASVPTYFDPEIVIGCTYGTAENPELLVDRLELGDGYEQVTESGINPVRQRVSMRFMKKRHQVYVALRRFFLGGGANSIYNRRPSEWFWIKLPYPFGRTTDDYMKMRVQSITGTAAEYNDTGMTVELVESFEP